LDLGTARREPVARPVRRRAGPLELALALVELPDARERLAVEEPARPLLEGEPVLPREADGSLPGLGRHVDVPERELAARPAAELVDRVLGRGEALAHPARERLALDREREVSPAEREVREVRERGRLPGAVAEGSPRLERGVEERLGRGEPAEVEEHL